jgi:hypothetical protein
MVSATSGMLRVISRKSRSVMTMRVMSEVATTEAVRGSSPRIPISPKKSPGPRSVRWSPSCVTSAVPSSMTKNS